MNEEFAKNIMMNVELVNNSVVNAKIDPKICDGLVHIFNLLDGTIYSPAIKPCWAVTLLLSLTLFLSFCVYISLLHSAYLLAFT